MRRAMFHLSVGMLCMLMISMLVSPGLALAHVNSEFAMGINQTGPYATSSGAVYVRGGPGTGFWVLGTLYAGEVVPIMNVSPDGAWWYIKAPFGDGWVTTIGVVASNASGVAILDPGPIATVTTGNLTVRYGAGINSAAVGYLKSGQQVFVLARNADSSWYQIQWSDGTGWASAAYLSLVGSPTTAPVSGDTPYGVVLSAYLNVRTGPGINYAILTTVAGGDILSIVGRTADNSWYQVDTAAGTGWIYSGFVATRNEYGASPVTTSSAAGAAIAGPIAIINTGALNIRSGPGPQYDRIGTLAGGTETQIIGHSMDWSWWLLNTSVGTGWASALYVIVRGDTSSVPYVAPGGTAPGAADVASGTAPEPALAAPMAVVVTGALNIRSGPNSSFSTLGAVYAGTRMEIVAQSQDHGWWLVESPFGRGWVSKLYVLVDGNISAIPVQQ